MSPPKSVIWELNPHTKAKHDILRCYLQAWFGIMSSWANKLVYIDGFAGPGEYMGGEEGSPIIALRTVLEHRKPITAEVILFFIENNRPRFEHLKQLTAALDRPPNINLRLACGDFEEELTRALDHVDNLGARLAPTFAFIDPFGWKGIPFAILQRIMRNPQCEILVNFMYENVNRFITHPDQPDNVDALFGTDRWRDVTNCQTPQERLRFIHGLYRDQLEHDANVQFVRSFEMIDQGRRTEYFLFHGTNHRLGLERMKDAMWKVDAAGGTVFSDATNLDQTVLFGREPDVALLERLMKNWGEGDCVKIEALEDFVLFETPFRKAHIRGVLRQLERSDQLVVHTERRVGTFPAGTEFTMVI